MRLVIAGVVLLSLFTVSNLSPRASWVSGAWMGSVIATSGLVTSALN
jgi:hypothetical protein